MSPTAKSSNAAALLVLLPAALFALLTSALTMRTQGGAAVALSSGFVPAYESFAAQRRAGCDQDLGRHMSETSRRVGEAELLPALRAALAFRHADPACAGSAVDAGSAADNRTLEVATLRGGSHT